MTKSELKGTIKECLRESGITSINDENIAVDEYAEYLDNNFLTFVNESSTSLKIRKIEIELKKYKEGEELLTVDKAEKIFHDIAALEGTDYEASMAKLMLTLLGLIIFLLGYATVLTSTDVIFAKMIKIGDHYIRQDLVGLSAMLVGLLTANGANSIASKQYFGISWGPLKGLYSKICKEEAKMKANLLKLEKLEDEDRHTKAKIDSSKKIIANYETIRKGWKQFVHNAENANKRTDNYKGGSSYRESLDLYMLDESGELVLNEMKVNRAKFELLKICVDDANELLKARIDYIDEVDDCLVKALEKISKVKTRQEAAEAVIELRKMGRDLDYRTDKDELLKDNALTHLRSTAAKFKNKYAFESVQYKKTIVNQLEKYNKQMEAVAKKYDAVHGEMNKKIFDAIDQIIVSDEFGYRSDKMIDALEHIVYSWEKAIISMSEKTTEQTNETIENLGGKVEKKFLYKVLNIKERRAARKAKKHD